MNFEFEIVHLDGLGQGVAKHDSSIFFIPKTLPEEKVSTEILSKSKGVHFCSAPLQVLKENPTRINASCPH